MKLKQKLLSTILAVMMLMSYVSTIGNAVIASAINLTGQNSKTNHANVEFNSYFEGGTYSKTFEIGSEAKLYLELKVKNTGCLKNGTIQFLNTNFEIDSNSLNNNKVQSSSKNEIKLKQINNSNDSLIIEVPITILTDENVPSNLFNKIVNVKFTATYIDENGKENSIKKEINNEVKWVETAEVELVGEITKYLPYELEEEKGILVQAKIKSGLKDNSLPVAKTKLELTIPEIKLSEESSISPERVTVIANTTLGTNGKESNEFSEENYSYNKEENKVEIEVINKEENGKISWNKNAVDEYIVTYVYTGEDIYNYMQEASKNAIKGALEVKATLQAYNGEETEIEKTEKINYSIEESKGNILDASISNTKSISKGYIYANYDKALKEASNKEIETKKDTNYEVSYTAKVYDKYLIDSVKFTTVAEKYIDSEEKEYSSKNDIYSKEVKISEKVFDKMLGEEGIIEITNKNGEKLAEITKDTEKDNSGNYIANIAKSKVNEIIIKTSKPVTEGNITIIVEKAISADQTYSKEDMKNFEKITLGVNASTIISNSKKTSEVKLTEPVSKAEISIGTQNLSTVVENKDVEFRVLLDTSSNENALYKNPTLQIVLPENIEKLTIKSVDLLLEDELKIKNTKVTEQDGTKVLQINLEGTQTKYMDNGTSKEVEQQNVIGKGANIIVKADITFKKLTPSKSANIILYYTNENSDLYEATKPQSKARTYSLKAAETNITGMARTGVDVVSPNGVITENYMSGYEENSNISNLTEEKQEQIISAFGTSKEVTIKGTIVNNHSNSIENVSILGRIPFSGNKQIGGTEELGSNFNMKMKNEITTTGIDSSKVKVYYSTNGEATKDLTNIANGWTENPENLINIKSYLIAITGQVATETQFNFEYKVTLPENLNYEKSSYTTYRVYYNNVETPTIQESKLAGTIGLTTGNAPELSVELQSTADIVREGQIVKMKATVTNTSSRTVNNVVLNAPVPENASFVGFTAGEPLYKINGDNRNITVGNIESGKSKEVSYYIQFNKNISNIPKEITQKVSVKADGITEPIYSNEYKFNVQAGEISIYIINPLDETIYQKGSTINCMINCENIGGTLNNTIITVPLPQGIKYKSAKINNVESSDSVAYDEQNNIINVNIGTLNSSSKISLELQVENLEGIVNISAKAKADGIEEHYSNVIECEVEKVNLEISELTATPRYVKEWERVTYTLTLTNKGKSAITGIKVVDELPEGLIFEQAIYPYANRTERVTTLKDGKVQINLGTINGGESKTITIIAIAETLMDTNDKEVKNKISITANNYDETITDPVINIIEPNTDDNGNENENGNGSGTGSGNTSGSESEGGNGSGNANGNGSSNQGGQSTKRYKITGTAWLDNNKDGKRADDEEILPGIQVILINKLNSQLVKDIDTGEQKIATTNEKGQYEFSNIPSGEYLVIFLYDAGKYSVTQYQAEQVDTSYNSDAINMKITLDGEQRYAGVTNTIKITNENARDIDIGLYVSEKFDLRLDKYISKVTVTTPTNGTKVYKYDNYSKITKADVYGKDVNNSNVIVEYKIVATNEGQIPGYAKKIIDYLPEDVRFNTELNKDWYIADNSGAVYNTSLANEKIEPGQSKEVTLILSLSITDKNIGTIVSNSAEIYESYNEQGIQDYDSQEANKLESEDDMSNADIILSVATGKIIIYTTLTLAIVMLLGFGIFEIKRYVLDKRIN